ncbi:MAG: hypothetical protein ACPG7F_15975 [Aggregatilineales bacterium]
MSMIDKFRDFHLYDYYRDGHDLMYSDPGAAYELFQQGKREAEVAGNHDWMLTFDHWTIQILLHSKSDYKRAHEQAIAGTLEARKPEYDDVQERICIHEDLISVYLGIDPVGYAEMLQQAIDYMDDEIEGDINCRFCLQSRKGSFALAMNDLDKAKEETNHFLAMSQDSPHYRANAHGDLCDILYRESRWSELLPASLEGERLARESEHDAQIILFLAWQTLAYQMIGQEDEAQQKYRQATATSAKFSRSVRGRDYYQALCHYHEVQGNLSESLVLRERQLSQIAGKGMLFGECQCRIAICKLKQQPGQDISADIQAAREVAAQLVYPDDIMAELDALEAN